MKYAIIALSMFSGVAMADCRDAANTTQELLDDSMVAANRLADGDITEANHRALARRVDSLERSLIGLRIHCHDQPNKIKVANKIADAIDNLRANIDL